MSDTQRLLDNILAEYAVDYESIARVIRILRGADPATDWIEELRDRAHAFAKFADIGLSVDWWVDTVDQMSR